MHDTVLQLIGWGIVIGVLGAAALVAADAFISWQIQRDIAKAVSRQRVGYNITFKVGTPPDAANRIRIVGVPARSYGPHRTMMYGRHAVVATNLEEAAPDANRIHLHPQE